MPGRGPTRREDLSPGALHRRIAQVRRSLATGDEQQDPAARRRLLEERARRLARPEPRRLREELRSEALELLRFRTASGEFALEPRWVVEVFQPRSLARLPHPRPPTTALTSWRGEIVPVLDLGQLLGGNAPEPVPKQPAALLLGTSAPTFALLAQAIPVRESVPRSTLEAVPAGLTADASLLRGVGPNGALVLDAEEILRRHG